MAKGMVFSTKSFTKKWFDHGTNRHFCLKVWGPYCKQPNFILNYILLYHPNPPILRSPKS